MKNKKQSDKKNLVIDSICPICGIRMLWLPVEPAHPDADYSAVCPRCVKRFDLSVVPKEKD